jgi:hypothetical protein
VTVVWGVDPSTVRVSIAWTDGADRRGVWTRSFDTGWRSPGLRMGHVLFGTSGLAAAVENESGAAPGLVLVEQPFGRPRPDPVSFMTVGAVLASLAKYLGWSDCIHLVPVPTWKKQAWGDAPDELKAGLWKRSEESKEALMRLARWDGYTGRLQDEADAWGIARAALTRVRA